GRVATAISSQVDDQRIRSSQKAHRRRSRALGRVLIEKTSKLHRTNIPVEALDPLKAPVYLPGPLAGDLQLLRRRGARCLPLWQGLFAIANIKVGVFADRIDLFGELASELLAAINRVIGT